MTSTVRARRAQSMQGRASASAASLRSPSLFDAIEAREEAIQRADDHADAEWKQDAYDCIALCARRGRPFTADDVAELLDQCASSTHEPSALGPVFLKASRDGVIRKTGFTRPSRLPRRHRDLVQWVGR